MLTLICYKHLGGEIMPIIESAKKRVRVTKKKTIRNKQIKNNLKSLEKEFLSSLENDTMEKSEELFNELQKQLHRAAEKNIFHKNKAARKISQFQKKLNSKAE